MRIDKAQAAVLTSKQVLISLILLLVNDWYLKAAWGNWFTGKLSDFSGIFLLALILFAFIPKWRVFVGLGIGLVWVWWKSPLSDGFLVIVHSAGLPQFDRVVDYTDLVALVMVPLAWASVARREDREFVELHRLRRAMAVPVLCVCAVAMVATSTTGYVGKFDVSKSEDAESLDMEAFLSAVDRVVQQYEMYCHECAEPEKGADYAQGGFGLSYQVMDDSSIRIWFSGHRSSIITDNGPSMARKLREHLIEAFGETLPGLRVTIELPDELDEVYGDARDFRDDGLSAEESSE